LPSVLVTLRTLQSGMKYKDCFFVHCHRICTCLNRIRVARRFCCPESFQIQIPQHIIWGNGNCMNMTTRILTSNCAIVEKRYEWSKNTYVLAQIFCVNHSYEYHKCAQGFLRKIVAFDPYVTDEILLQMQRKSHLPNCKYYS
jgi:hypothetical protein